MKKIIKNILYYPTSPKFINFLFNYNFRQKPTNNFYKSILIIKLDEIGDFVISSAFLRELRRNFTDSKITLVIKKDLYNLAEYCPYVDNIEIFEVPTSKLFLNYKFLYTTFLFAKNKLWKFNFDLALIPRWDIDTYFSSYIAYFSRAKERIAYSENATSLKKTYNKDYDIFFTKVLESKIILHEVMLNLNILEKIGCEIFSNKLEVWLSEKDIQYANSEFKFNENDYVIAIVPGALNKNRQWPIENYKLIISHLLKLSKCKFIFFGGYSEISLAQFLTNDIDSNYYINLVGRTTIRETAAMLKKCNLYLGNDTGVKHIAAAVGLKVIEISRYNQNGLKMHNQSPFRFHAWGVENIILQPYISKDNCGDDCLYNYAHCITGVDVEDLKFILNHEI